MRPLDLRALGLFDANVDVTAEEIVSGAMALRNLGLDVNSPVECSRPASARSRSTVRPAQAA